MVAQSKTNALLSFGVYEVIAPHINNEVRLVLAGNKPLATIEKAKDKEGYSLAIALSNVGMLAVQCSPTADSPAGEVIITKPANKGLITKYLNLLESGVSLFGIKEYHRKMGALFGYSKQDINDFISAEIDCNCTKCKGH